MHVRVESFRMVVCDTVALRIGRIGFPMDGKAAVVGFYLHTMGAPSVV